MIFLLQIFRCPVSSILPLVSVTHLLGFQNTQQSWTHHSILDYNSAKTPGSIQWSWSGTSSEKMWWSSIHFSVFRQCQTFYLLFHRAKSIFEERYWRLTILTYWKRPGLMKVEVALFWEKYSCECTTKPIEGFKRISLVHTLRCFWQKQKKENKQNIARIVNGTRLSDHVWKLKDKGSALVGW